MLAEPASAESQGCLSVLSFNSFYSELHSEVQPAFTDQNTWQIGAPPGNGEQDPFDT